MLTCPNCLADIRYHVVDHGLAQPEPGDYAVCFSCGERMIFSLDQQFIALTDETVRELPLEWQEGIERIWTVWNETYSIRGS